MRVTDIGKPKELYEIVAEKRDEHGILKARKTHRFWNNEPTLLLGWLQSYAREGYFVTFRLVGRMGDDHSGCGRYEYSVRLKQEMRNA